MKKFLIFSIGIVVYYLILNFVFKGQDTIFPIFMISSFIFSFYISKKEMIYSFSLLTVIWFIHFFRETSIISNIIIYFIFTPLSFFLGYYLKTKNVLFKASYVALLIIIGIYGFTNFWFIKTNFNARKTAEAPEMIYNFNEKQVQLDKIKNKVIVVDYWTTSCGVCFDKFPEYEKLYQKYSENSEVLLYAVNIPLKRDTIGYAKQKIEKFNYKFPVLYANSDITVKALGFNKYPHLVILKNGKVRFNGYPNLNEKNTFVYALEDEIERVLNEK